MSDYYEVIMDGGGPWGIRLQGGKDFGVPLNVARVTPQSKASMKGLTAGDQILSINNHNTDTLTHMEAQNLIKGAGDRLQLGLKKGTGVSLGDAKEIGAGGFNANPNQTLYQTEVTHSAGVDHKFNAKPHAFITQHNASAGGVTHHSEQLNKFDPSKRTPVVTSAPRFDPGEYARKKKEELENYKKEPKSDDLVDSDVLQMLKKTTVQEPKGQTGGSGPVPAAPAPAPVALFGMAPPGAAPPGHALPGSGVGGGGGDAGPKADIMGALQSRMKEMKIDKDKLDRSASVSNENKGRYLSQTSRESAARPKSPNLSARPGNALSPGGVIPPTSPSNFKSSIKGGGNPTGVQGANVVVGDLKDRLKGDRMHMGLKQTRGMGGGSTSRKLEESTGFKARDTSGPAPTTATSASDDLGEEL